MIEPSELVFGPAEILQDALEQVESSMHRYEFSPEALGVVVGAARRWAELEAQVADGARVVIQTRCPACGPHHNPFVCLADDVSRVILGEGTE